MTYPNPTGLPLRALFYWSPFRLDALGLVTILGAEEVNRAVDLLVHNRYCEYIPLLGGFVFAGNRFTETIQGCTRYAIDNGIKATDSAGWFTRWLLAQNFDWNTSVVIWGFRQHPRPIWREEATALCIGVLVNASLTILTVLIGAWFGLANALSMILSVLVKWYLVAENRAKLDELATSVFAASDGRMRDPVRHFVTLSDGTRCHTICSPRHCDPLLFTEAYPLASTDLPRISGSWLAQLRHTHYIHRAGLSIHPDAHGVDHGYWNLDNCKRCRQ